ncbi:hypothetical protein [Mycolicibacterium agri]|uniref:hypothetical protein n=1 Tax=Mycolicibacterium agri TaxID=36811 RepID=UPI001054B2CD|nr:hypothetical protein [Mycolicibacterium agri]
MQTRSRHPSNVRAIGMLLASIVITAALAAATLIDALATASAASPECTSLVHPLGFATEFVDPSC